MHRTSVVLFAGVLFSQSAAGQGDDGNSETPTTAATESGRIGSAQPIAGSPKDLGDEAKGADGTQGEPAETPKPAASGVPEDPSPEQAGSSTDTEKLKKLIADSVRLQQSAESTKRTAQAWFEREAERCSASESDPASDACKAQTKAQGAVIDLSRGITQAQLSEREAWGALSLKDKKNAEAQSAELAAVKTFELAEELVENATGEVKAAEDRATAVAGNKVLSNGTRMSWGVTTSLLKFQTSRSPNLPGRNSEFRPKLRAIPGDLGFQFVSEPATFPWRVNLQDGDTLQLISYGGMLLTEVGSDEPFEQGSLSVAFTLSFFDNVVGAGLGFDLYRGIPILGADGTSGGDTAFTGPLAWAFAHEGEVTAENAFIVVFANVSTLIGALTGTKDTE